MNATTEQNSTHTPMTAEVARQVYAMGFVPAIEAGHSPYEALEAVRADNAARLDARAALGIETLFVGKAVNDGRLGWIEEIDGNRVKLSNMRNQSRWVHAGMLNEWSFRLDAKAEG